MFEECNTLAELNAARTKLSLTEDLVVLNNAYNARRSEILQKRSNFVRQEFIKCAPNPVIKYCGIPLAGESKEPGVIKLTERGFLF